MRRPAIAVVEDNDDNRLLLRALFAERYDLHEYSDGPEAIAGFANHIPDVILLDVSLPGMDGFEVLRTIRADERLRELPVVALTAHVMAGDRERILAAGFNEYVSKPIVDEEVLFKAVERLLGQSSSSNG